MAFFGQSDVQTPQPTHCVASKTALPSRTLIAGQPMPMHALQPMHFSASTESAGLCFTVLSSAHGRRLITTLGHSACSASWTAARVALRSYGSTTRTSEMPTARHSASRSTALVGSPLIV